MSRVAISRHWKRGICIKFSEIDLKFATKFATILHPSSDVRNEVPAILPQIWLAICDKFTQRPPCERPLSHSPEAILGIFQPLSEYGFAYGLKMETCQFSKNFLASPTVKERKHILSEYIMSTTVSIVWQYGLSVLRPSRVKFA